MKRKRRETGAGEFEQLVLLALLRLGNGAYGAAIHREIVARTGRRVSQSAVYVALDRLEAKKMVCGYVGRPTGGRGGRRRRHYLLDTAGQRVVLRTYRSLAAMRNGLPPEIDAIILRLAPADRSARPAFSRTRW
jgi:DNA-binding PadR family transcriptional regulator